MLGDLLQLFVVGGLGEHRDHHVFAVDGFGAIRDRGAGGGHQADVVTNAELGLDLGLNGEQKAGEVQVGIHGTVEQQDGHVHTAVGFLIGDHFLQGLVHLHECFGTHGAIQRRVGHATRGQADAGKAKGRVEGTTSGSSLLLGGLRSGCSLGTQACICKRSAHCGLSVVVRGGQSHFLTPKRF